MKFAESEIEIVNINALSVPFSFCVPFFRVDGELREIASCCKPQCLKLGLFMGRVCT